MCRGIVESLPLGQNEAGADAAVPPPGRHQPSKFTWYISTDRTYSTCTIHSHVCISQLQLLPGHPFSADVCAACLQSGLLDPRQTDMLQFLCWKVT